MNNEIFSMDGLLCAELIRSGAQVLHDRSVELAKEHGITLEVLSAFTGAPGTIVGD